MMIKKNVVLFCVTDFCNAGCEFCSFWRTKKITFPKKEELIKAIKNTRKKLSCGAIQFTGGEPLTYPFIFDAIKAAGKAGMITQMMTNGSLLNTKNIAKLEEAGLDALAISLDHYDYEIMEGNRKIKGLMEKVKKGAQEAKKTNMLLQAGITVSRFNMNDLEKITKFAIKLGFDEIHFCLPMTHLDSSYKLGSGKKGTTEDLTNKNMAKIMDNIIKLKKKFHKEVAHSNSFLEDMKKFYLGEEQKYPCKGGENMFYLDNKLTVYQCMKKSKKLGNINNDVKIMKNVKCYDCPLQCFREPSFYIESGMSLFLLLSKADKAKNLRILGKIIRNLFR